MSELVQYVTFEDSFVSGGEEAKKIKLGFNNIELFYDTLHKIQETLLDVELAKENPELYDEEQMQERREDTMRNQALTEEQKQRELAYLDKLESIVSEISVNSDIDTQISRIINNSSRLLQMKTENMRALAEQSLDVKKLEDWKEKSKKDNVLPLEREISPETLQVAIDEVQDAFNSLTAEKDLEISDMQGLFGEVTQNNTVQPVQDKEKQVAQIVEPTIVEMPTAKKEEYPVLGTKEISENAISETDRHVPVIGLPEQKDNSSVKRTVKHMDVDDFLNNYNATNQKVGMIVVEPSGKKVEETQKTDPLPAIPTDEPKIMPEKEKVAMPKEVEEQDKSYKVDLNELPVELRDDPEIQKLLEERTSRQKTLQEQEQTLETLTAQTTELKRENMRLSKEQLQEEKKTADTRELVEKAKKSQKEVLETMKKDILAQFIQERESFEAMELERNNEIVAAQMAIQNLRNENKELGSKTEQLREEQQKNTEKVKAIQETTKKWLSANIANVALEQVVNHTQVGGVMKTSEPNKSGKTM